MDAPTVVFDIKMVLDNFFCFVCSLHGKRSSTDWSEYNDIPDMCYAIIIVCVFNISWKWFVTHSNNSGSKIYTETADLLRKQGGKTGEELKDEGK